MNVGGRDILYHDEEITVYPAVGKERLCSDGRHLVVVVNRHLESVYDLVRPLRSVNMPMSFHLPLLSTLHTYDHLDDTLTPNRSYTRGLADAAPGTS
jgi:hypothetical protein